VLPVDGSRPEARTWFPPVGGFRFAFVTFPPEAAAAPADAPDQASLEELEAKLPGLAQFLEPEYPGMHTTDTVDFGVVVSGEVWLELDDGAEVQLRAGDCVVQNGTRHAWRNKSAEPCITAFAWIGAARVI
jgi:mannose-6-phosphate isomerase-like protein (cupin superfamily)